MTWETYWIIFGLLVAGLIISELRNAHVRRHNARMAALREEQARIVASIPGDMAKIYGRRGRR